jgi:hypothetical protein
VSSCARHLWEVLCTVYGALGLIRRADTTVKRHGFPAVFK